MVFVDETNYSIKAVFWLKSCTFTQGPIVCLHCSVVFHNKAVLANTVIVQENSGGLWKLREETQDVKDLKKRERDSHYLKELSQNLKFTKGKGKF